MKYYKICFGILEILPLVIPVHSNSLGKERISFLALVCIGKVYIFDQPNVSLNSMCKFYFRTYFCIGKLLHQPCVFRNRPVQVLKLHLRNQVCIVKVCISTRTREFLKNVCTVYFRTQLVCGKCVFSNSHAYF